MQELSPEMEDRQNQELQKLYKRQIEEGTRHPNDPQPTIKELLVRPIRFGSGMYQPSISEDGEDMIFTRVAECEDTPSQNGMGLPISPCPFCKSADVYMEVVDGLHGYFVVCRSCECEGPMGTKQQAITKWNQAQA